MTPNSECADPFGPLFFERVLSPHRSLPARGFHVLMGLLGLISLAVGIGFVSIGAWPVIGFFGLDVGLVYLAFRLNYRSARQSETLRLAGDAFTVERVSVRVLVASHGRSLVIGDFVPPTTRRDLAVTITEALVRWRKSFNPAVADDEKRVPEVRGRGLP
jgi:uncharacterized membrane protein